MTLVEENIRNYIETLQRRIAQLESVIAASPKGQLVIRHRKDAHYFSQRFTENGKRFDRYLSPTDHADTVRLLSDKKYAEWVLPSLRKNLKAAEYFVRFHSGAEEDELASEFNHRFPTSCANLYTPSDMFTENWLSATWEECPANQDQALHQTIKGDLVRSKSEEFIANSLYYHDQAYLYEKPLWLPGLSFPFFPDFTILNAYTRLVCYWEHFGKMDDPDYAQKALRKISTYHRNGIIIGVNLICTFESKAVPFTYVDAERIVTEYFCRNRSGLYIPSY